MGLLIVSGTYCKGQVQGTFAQKFKTVRNVIFTNLLNKRKVFTSRFPLIY